MVEWCSDGILPDIKNIPLGNGRMRIVGSVEIEQLFCASVFYPTRMDLSALKHG
jgi:hypothetical protein